VFTEHELYMAMAVIFVCIFFDFDPAASFPLHMVAGKLSKVLGKLVEANVKAVNMTGWIAGVVNALHQKDSHLNDYGVHMVRRLLDSGMGAEEVAWSQVLPTAIAMVPNQAQVVSSFPLSVPNPNIEDFGEVNALPDTQASSPKPSTITSPQRAGNTFPKSTAWPNSTRRRPTTSLFTTAWKASV
jgi:hypothetical protein